MLFVSSADSFKKLLSNAIIVPNSLDPDQAGHFVRPNQGINQVTISSVRVNQKDYKNPS